MTQGWHWKRAGMKRKQRGKDACRWMPQGTFPRRFAAGRWLVAVAGAALLGLCLPMAEARAGESELPTLPATPETPVRAAFEGNTVFTSEELARVAQPVLDEEGTTLLTIEKARVAITEHYVRAGYINSGATVPPQDIGAGVLVFQITEGRLTKVEITGNRWFAKRIYEQAFRDTAEAPLRIQDIQTDMETVRQRRNLKQINGDLQPGGQPGEAVLALKVKEEFPHHAGVQFRNDLPASSGAHQVDLWVQSSSLTRNADELNFQYGLYRFGQGKGDFLEGDNYSVDYRIPFTPWETQLGGFVRRSTASVVEEPFNLLDISSDTRAYGVLLEQPLHRSLRSEWTVSLTGERKASETFLFDQPYSFSNDLPPGGETAVSVARLATQYTRRSTNDVFSARATLNQGFDALNATKSDQHTDGRFTSVTGQAQYLLGLPGTGASLLLQAAGQWADQPLLPVEQFSVGGAHTVRGYRENTLVRDTGVYGGVELRMPILGAARGHWLQLCPFFDAGAGWNRRGPRPDVESIQSVGIGLRSNPSRRINASLFWGHALRDDLADKNDPQDYGFHFKLNIMLF